MSSKKKHHLAELLLPTCHFILFIQKPFIQDANRTNSIFTYFFMIFNKKGTFEVDFIVSDYVPFSEVLPKTLF